MSTSLQLLQSLESLLGSPARPSILNLGLEVRNHALGVLSAEEGSSGYDDIRASLGAASDSAGSDSSVDLDVNLGETSAELGDLGNARGDELLASLTC
jgi:hypothetical protein